MDISEHATNGQQEQEGERDPRSLPPVKSWAEVIADSNRKLAVMRRRMDEQNRRIGQLTMERDEAIATIARQDEEIAGLLQCLDWDEWVVSEQEKAPCEPPPF